MHKLLNFKHLKITIHVENKLKAKLSHFFLDLYQDKFQKRH